VFWRLHSWLHLHTGRSVRSASLPSLDRGAVRRAQRDDLPAKAGRIAREGEPRDGVQKHYRPSDAAQACERHIVSRDGAQKNPRKTDTPLRASNARNSANCQDSINLVELQDPALSHPTRHRWNAARQRPTNFDSGEIGARGATLWKKVPKCYRRHSLLHFIPAFAACRSARGCSCEPAKSR
jgi:hypothetical protein